MTSKPVRGTVTASRRSGAAAGVPWTPAFTTGPPDAPLSVDADMDAPPSGM
ncbi:hypothetical protein [Streptomyces sp. OP7]|uniref:hypothetical protein n=1 Tax=Streptomyces sp. OP7 TaxID=3142462 RepID=UPI0032E9101A